MCDGDCRFVFVPSRAPVRKMERVPFPRLGKVKIYHKVQFHHPWVPFFRKKMHFKFFLEQKMVCRTLRNAFFTLTESENGYTSIPIYLMGLKMADRALSARSLDANSLWGKMSERKCQGGESSPKIPHNQFQSVC